MLLFLGPSREMDVNDDEFKFWNKRYRLQCTIDDCQKDRCYFYKPNIFHMHIEKKHFVSNKICDVKVNNARRPVCNLHFATDCFYKGKNSSNCMQI